MPLQRPIRLPKRPRLPTLQPACSTLAEGPARGWMYSLTKVEQKTMMTMVPGKTTPLKGENTRLKQHNHPATALMKTRRHHPFWLVRCGSSALERTQRGCQQRKPLINPENNVLTFFDRTDIFSWPPHHKLTSSWPPDTLGDGWKPPESKGRGRHGDNGTGTNARHDICHANKSLWHHYFE